MLDENHRKLLRDLTVQVLLEIRLAYLRSPGGSPLKAWDQIQDRLRMAARTAAGPEEWLTSLSKSLQLGPPSLRCSKWMRELIDAVPTRAAADEWLRMLEEQHAYIIALARLAVDERRAVQEEKGQ